MSCAYCRNVKPPTREHIWPKWLHDADDYSLKYHAAADKVLPVEHVIKDVCAECNNGPLSKLDDYVKSLHDRYFSKGYQKIKNATFNYDFEKLVKWLLKVSYNSARMAHASDVGLLSRYAPYIVTPGCLPAFVGISVSLLGQLIEIDPKTNITKVAELSWCRTGPILLSETYAAAMTVRTVMIRGWRFMLVVMKNAEFKAEEADFIFSVLQGAIIRPDSAPIKVPTIPLDANDVLKHFRDKGHLYDEASNKLRR